MILIEVKCGSVREFLKRLYGNPCTVCSIGIAEIFLVASSHVHNATDQKICHFGVCVCVCVKMKETLINDAGFRWLASNLWNTEKPSLVNPGVEFGQKVCKLFSFPFEGSVYVAKVVPTKSLNKQIELILRHKNPILITSFWAHNRVKWNVF